MDNLTVIEPALKINFIVIEMCLPLCLDIPVTERLLKDRILISQAADDLFQYKHFWAVN